MSHRRERRLTERHGPSLLQKLKARKAVEKLNNKTLFQKIRYFFTPSKYQNAIDKLENRLKWQNVKKQFKKLQKK